LNLSCKQAREERVDHAHRRTHKGSLGQLQGLTKHLDPLLQASKGGKGLTTPITKLKQAV